MTTTPLDALRKLVDAIDEFSDWETDRERLESAYADARAFIAAADAAPGICVYKHECIAERQCSETAICAKEAAAEASVAGEQTCTRCNGSGTVSAMAGQGPDAYDVDVDCPECRGTGARPAADPPQPAVKVPARLDKFSAMSKFQTFDYEASSAMAEGWNACRAETIRLNAARIKPETSHD